MEKPMVISPLSQAQRNSSKGQGSAPKGGFNPLVPELDVSDIATSLTFWCEYLGFHIVYDRPAAGFAFCKRDGAQVMLCQVNDEWVTGPLERPFGRGVNFQIMVDDIAPLLARLKEAGWPLFRDAREAWYRIGDEERGSREFLVLDPDGYLVRLSQSLGIRDV
jgi:catechol 2,3-dioxygenase-like lactoylglutathione lyase family enzyme